MTNTRDIIIRLKEVREEKGLSYSNILDLMEQNGDFVSKSTLSRLFSDGSEDMASTFKYETTLRPIAKVLLDIENIEDDDNIDTQAMKSLLKYKIQRIEELEQQIEQMKRDYALEKVADFEAMSKERAAWGRSIEFLKEQISYKDQRMDLLLQAVRDKDQRYEDLLKIILSCPCRQKAEVDHESR
jgi:transcriptional regulator with XRE-family HTH domain